MRVAWQLHMHTVYMVALAGQAGLYAFSEYTTSPRLEFCTRSSVLDNHIHVQKSVLGTLQDDGENCISLAIPDRV